METLVTIWQWIESHPALVILYISLLGNFCSAISNATPNKSDDKVVNAVFKAIHAVAFNFFHLKTDTKPVEAPATEEPETEPAPEATEEQL
jgi:hypothetical protein